MAANMNINTVPEQNQPRNNNGANSGGNMPNMANMTNMGNINNINNLASLGMLNFNGMGQLSQIDMQRLLLQAINPNNPIMFNAGMPINFGNMANMGMMSMNMQGNPNLNYQNQNRGQANHSLFKEQLTRFKSYDDAGSRDPKQVFPLKRSAYHVAISYKIYLDRLKKEGRNFDNLEDIDPTKSARRVKTNQGGKGGSQSVKKKK